LDRRIIGEGFGTVEFRMPVEDDDGFQETGSCFVRSCFEVAWDRHEEWVNG